MLERLRERRADLCVVGGRHVVVTGTGLALPAGVVEELSSVLEILPLQLLASSISLARGFTPDAPCAFTKVTETP